MKKFEGIPNEIKKEKQILEGKIDDLAGFESGDWEKTLPNNLTLHEIDLFLKEGSWYWHLKTEHINDEEEREKWEKERLTWANDS